MNKLKKKKKISKTTGIVISGKNNKFINCGIEGFDTAINLKEKSKGNQFIDTDLICNNPKTWYSKPLGIILLGVIACVIFAAIMFLKI